MFEDMMGRLQEMQLKMEESKKRLDRITVTGEAAGGKVEVTATGNRRITAVKIDDELLQTDREELEDLLVVALNRALENADRVWDAEMKGMAGNMLGQ